MDLSNSIIGILPESMDLPDIFPMMEIVVKISLSSVINIRHLLHLYDL